MASEPDEVISPSSPSAQKGNAPTESAPGQSASGQSAPGQSAPGQSAPDSVSGTTYRLALSVLALAFLMNLCARGFGETFSVFILPMSQDLGWSRGDLTGIYAGYMITHGLAAPFLGVIVERWGGRVTYCWGLALYGVGFLMASQATELWQAYVGLALCAGLGIAAIGMVPATSLISRWFDKRMSTAMAVAYAGLGTGVIVIVPATQWLIVTSGWRSSYETLGLILLACVPLVFVMPWKRWNTGSTLFQQSVIERAKTPTRAWLPIALGSTPFYGLIAVFFFTAVAIYVVSVQAVAFLIDAGYSPIVSATAFGVVGMLSVVGMVATGWLADRYNRRRVVTLSYSLTIIGVLFLWKLEGGPSLPALVGFILCFGLSQGARGPIISTLVAKLYPGHVGPIYGAVTIGLGFGAAFGAWLSGYLYDLTGNYHAGLMVSLAASGAGVLQFWISRPLATGQHNQ